MWYSDFQANNILYTVQYRNQKQVTLLTHTLNELKQKLVAWLRKMYLNKVWWLFFIFLINSSQSTSNKINLYTWTGFQWRIA